MANVTLTPVAELAPGQVAAIRNSVIDAVVAKAAKELGMPEENLVVRDIRAFNDIGFGANTDYIRTNAQSTDVWGTFKVSTTYTTSGTSGAYRDAVADNDTMADNRYVVIYGVRDARASLDAILGQDVSLIKFDIGAADRVIWDLTKMNAYVNAIAGITPSAVLIPPLAPYQISCYLMAGNVKLYVQLMGVVVEPRGLLITP